MKSIFKSKTFWLNAVAIGCSVGGQFPLPEVNPNVTMGVVASANIVLRLLTKQPVGLPEILAAIGKAKK